MCCERMTECMRTYFFLQVDFLRETFDDCEYHDTCQLRSSPVQKNKIFMPLLNRHVIPDLIKINPDQFGCNISDWNQSFLITFSGDFYKTNFQMKISYFQINKFAYSQTSNINCIKI